MTSHILFILQIAVGMIFLGSASYKVADVRRYLLGVRSYGVISDKLAAPIAVAIIAFELLIAISHLGSWRLDMIIPLSLALMCVFLVAVCSVLMRGLAVRCLCYGAQSNRVVSMRTVYELIMLSAAELVLWKVGVGLTHSNSANLVEPSVVVALFPAALFLTIATWLISIPELIEASRGCQSCTKDDNHRI